MLIDTTQHYLQLKALGYKDGDTIFYRQFPPKGSKGYASKTKQILPCIIQEQNPNKGLYFVVNGQGQTDKDIKTCRAFFAEWDDRPLEEQEELWQAKGFLEPTFQVKTRKSIHCYWVLKEPIPVEDWRILQTRLLELIEGDKTLKNPSRVMRVAGGWHIKSGEEPVKCELINPTDRRYSQAEIEQALEAIGATGEKPLDPPQKPKPKPTKKAIAGDSPLDDLERDKHLALEILEFLPPTVPDSGTYGTYREIAVALKNIFSEPEAIMLMAAHSPERNWQQIIPSSNGDFGIGTLVHHARAMVGWDYPQWWKDSIKSESKPGGKKVEAKTSTPLQELSEYDGGGTEETQQTGLTERATEPKYPAHVQATRDIYGDGNYIALENCLYGWNGTHYEKLDQGEEIRKFREWAEQNPVYNPKTEREEYQYMTPSFLEKCWKWVMAEFAIRETNCNPPGLNLKNGVLRFDFKGRQVKWELSPHNPKDYFLYCSDVEFRPDADPAKAHQLLEALDPEPREVFLRTIAAAIDLENVRKVLGRGVRAAICRGSGANGKDSLKEAITMIFGERQIASASFGDFVSYDQGRKFDLAKLRGVRFNWPSENNQKNTLDLSESMNAAITGDRGLVYERKGKDGEDFTCQAVHLFNCNQLPKMKTGLDSLKTRFCVLDFFKTYKPDPDPSRGELLADPRFKYDPVFMVEEVCPGLLNLILAELPLLLTEGINYQAIADSLEDIQEESTHLWEFCKEYGVVPDPDGRVWVHDLWFKLQSFYLDNGTLERVDQPDGGFKNIWHEQANRWDANVTGPNQIFKRLKQLFPKIDKRRETQRGDFCGRFYLVGISFNSASTASTPDFTKDFASATASTCFSILDSASAQNKKESLTTPLEPESLKQKLKQNGQSAEAKIPLQSHAEALKQKNQKSGQKNSPENSNGTLTEDQKLMAATIKAEMDRLKLNPWQMKRICQEKYGKDGFLELNEPEQLDLYTYLAARET